jgi:pimeloyl-ACP methyl ester carboxylesterase
MLLALLLLQASPVERWLAEPDKAARAKLLPSVQGSPAEVEEEIRKGPLRPDAPAQGQVVRKRLKADHPAGGDFEYVLWVPKSYDPSKKWRLWITLHGQNGNGDQMIGRWLPDMQARDDTFLLCPSAGRGGWGTSTLGHAYILGSMRDVAAAYAIDPDRVFLDGASMGGNGSFQFLCTYPDLFAAGAPRSGGPMFRYQMVGKDKVLSAEGLENLAATPLYWTVGAQDREVPNEWVKVAKTRIDELKIDCVFQEYPNGGHEWFPQENAKILEWAGSKRRDACPPRAAVWSRDRIFNRAFWLEVTDFKGKEFPRDFVDFDKKKIEERKWFPEPFLVQAELGRGTNEFKVTAAGAKELRLHLHERMVDFSKPVVVTVNGSKSTHTAKPSVEALLESARRDRGLLYSASIKVRVP